MAGIGINENTDTAGDEGFGGDAGMSFTKHRLDNFCEIITGQAPSGEAYNIQGKGWPLIAGAGDFKEGDRLIFHLSPFPLTQFFDHNDEECLLPSVLTVNLKLDQTQL